MSEAERKFFVSKLRYFWDIARHRIPLPAKEKIQQLRFENKLHIISGKLTGLIEQNGTVHVSFYDKTLRINREIKVSRVINCTGPATDLRHVEKSLLKDCREKGIVAQDSLKLGINADIETLQVLNAAGHRNSNLFTIGPPLKGMLWETIAVNELRIQAEKLSARILTRT
jgi:uncharacterized NAD(P)/FAD-binding protein YdhS